MKPVVPVRSVLFDLDGTLVDTAQDFEQVLHLLCQENGRRPPGSISVRQTVSSGAKALVQLAFPLPVDSPEFIALHQRLLQLYAQQIENSQAVLYPGMRELLDYLQHMKMRWGIVTNKPKIYSKVLVEKLSLEQHCAVLICPEHVKNTKPHPEPLLLACRQMGLASQDVVYVGDHPRDIESGRAAGMFTIAAAYGYLPLEPPVENWGASMVVNSANEILQWVQTSGL